MRIAVQLAVLLGSFCGFATVYAGMKMCAPARQMLQSVSTESAQKFELLAEDCAITPTGNQPKQESELLKHYDSHPLSKNLHIAYVPSFSSNSVVTATPASNTQIRSNSNIASRYRFSNLALKKPGSLNIRAVAIAPKIKSSATAYDIDPLFLHAIAHVESRHNPNAVSIAGAKGVLQVMPATARRFGITNPSRDLLDPQLNIDVGSAYLKSLQTRFGNNLPLVLAAYNAGEGAVEKYGRRIPPYIETQDYVREVLNQYRELRTLTQVR
jgi:soluble lytic murein transglycosylase-like protein